MKRTVRFFKFEKGKWWLTCPGISSIVLSKISPWSPNSEKLSKQLLALLNGFPDNANAHGWEVWFPKCSWRNWLQKMNWEIYEMLRCQYSSVGVELPTHVPKIRRLSVIFICLSTRGQAVRSQWQSWQMFSFWKASMNQYESEALLFHTCCGLRFQHALPENVRRVAICPKMNHSLTLPGILSTPNWKCRSLLRAT